MGIKNIIVKGFSLLKPIPLKDKIINYASLEVAIKGIFAEIKKKEPKITRTDVPENNNQKVFSALGALNLKNWLVTNYTTLMNNIRDSLTTLINGKLSHGGYGGTGQTLFNLIESAKTALTSLINANKSKLESLQNNKQDKQDDGLLTPAKFIVGAINSLFLEKTSLEHLKEYGIGDLLGGVKKKKGGQYTANECIDFGVYANENGDKSQGGLGGQATIFNTCFGRDYYGFQIAQTIGNNNELHLRFRTGNSTYGSWGKIYNTFLVDREIKPFLVASEIIIATDGRKWLKEVYDNFERYSLKRGDLNIKSTTIHSPVQVDIENLYGMISSNDNRFGTRCYFSSGTRIFVENESLAITMISFNLWKGGA